jgi:hypothetical protein
MVYKAHIDTLDAIGTEMARPTKYSAAVQKKADDYVISLPTGQVVHTVEGLADHLDVHRDTLYAWRDQHPEFSDTLDRVLKKQAVSLINNGLMGDFNSAIAKLMLANHGYRERSEVDNKSSDGSFAPAVIQNVIVRPGDADYPVSNC